MEEISWGQLRYLEKQFAAHKAAAAKLRGHESDLVQEVADRLDTLEFNASRLLLIVQTLAEICRLKKVFSEQEFTAFMQAVDLSDGQADGVLSSSCVSGMRPAPQSTSFYSFLRQASKTAPGPPTDPREYLAQLERDDE